jgi:hypothetical protein
LPRMTIELCARGSGSASTSYRAEGPQAVNVARTEGIQSETSKLRLQALSHPRGILAAQLFWKRDYCRQT